MYNSLYDICIYFIYTHTCVYTYIYIYIYIHIYIYIYIERPSVIRKAAVNHGNAKVRKSVPCLHARPMSSGLPEIWHSPYIKPKRVQRPQSEQLQVDAGVRLRDQELCIYHTVSSFQY